MVEWDLLKRREEKGLGAEGVGPVYKAARQSGHRIGLRLPSANLLASSCLRNKHKQKKYKTLTKTRKNFTEITWPANDRPGARRYRVRSLAHHISSSPSVGG